LIGPGGKVIQELQNNRNNKLLSMKIQLLKKVLLKLRTDPAGIEAVH
jgi:hypothetical protein